MALVTLPGLIDPHVHLRDPGETEKEDFYTGTSAALHGGFTTLLDMPNNLQPITSEEKLNEKIKSASEKIVCDIGFYFGSLRDNLDQFPLIQNKVFGLKVFLNHTTGDYIIDEAKLIKIYTAWPGKRPILVHAEDKAVEMVINTIKQTGKRTHICHVSSKFELQLIIEAKEQGLPITCGVTPHHLFLSTEDVSHLGSLVKVRPPLRSREDVAYLWKHIQAIDVIESDHAPHLIDEKRSDNPPNGVPGLETTLPLLLTAASEGRISIEQIVSMCYEKPKEIFSIPIQPDTYIEVDTEQTFTIKNNDLFTKCKWSPFDGWKVKGEVKSVSVRGVLAYKSGEILVKPGFGKIL